MKTSNRALSGHCLWQFRSRLSVDVSIPPRLVWPLLPPLRQEDGGGALRPLCLCPPSRHLPAWPPHSGHGHGQPPGRASSSSLVCSEPSAPCLLTCPGNLNSGPDAHTLLSQGPLSTLGGAVSSSTPRAPPDTPGALPRRPRFLPVCPSETQPSLRPPFPPPVPSVNRLCFMLQQSSCSQFAGEHVSPRGQGVTAAACVRRVTGARLSSPGLFSFVHQVTGLIRPPEPLKPRFHVLFQPAVSRTCPVPSRQKPLAVLQACGGLRRKPQSTCRVNGHAGRAHERVNGPAVAVLDFYFACAKVSIFKLSP